MKRKVYSSRAEKQGDFWVGFVVFPILAVGVPAVLVNFVHDSNLAAGGSILALVFLIVAGVYRPWMAIGGLGCIGALIAVGLLASIFLAVVCSSGFR